MVTRQSYGRVIQVDSNPPYSEWTDLEVLNGKDYGNSSICYITNDLLNPSSLIFNEFDFNLPVNGIVEDITVFYSLHVDEPSLELREPTVTIESGNISESIRGDNIISNEYVERSVTFNETGRLVNNLDINDINGQDLQVTLDFDRLNNETILTNIYLDYVYVEVTYNLTSPFELYNTEVNNAFPTIENPKLVEVYDTFTYTLRYQSPNGTHLFTNPYTGESNIITYIEIDVPNGLEVVGFSGAGTFDYTNNRWYPQINNTDPVNAELIIQADTTGLKRLQASSNYTDTDGNSLVNTYPYYVKVTNPKRISELTTENFVISTPDLYINKLGQKVRALIQTNNDYDKIYIRTGVTGYLRWMGTIEIVSATNIKDMNVTYSNSNITITNIVKEDNNNSYIGLELDIPISVRGTGNNSKYIEIRVDSEGKTRKTPIIHPNQPIIGLFNTDKYYWNEDTYHILKEYDPTTPTNDTDFILYGTCDEKYYMRDCDLGILLEPIQGYIGPIKLTRSHSNPKNDTTNTLIKEQYQNRINYGKKGDYNESRTSSIRLPPKDIKLLQGLTQLDKPVPIDTAPLLPDGDPLTLRGWAELYGVKGITKINSRIYECQPQLEFLTHDVNTRFNVTRGERIKDYELPRVYETSLLATDLLGEYFTQTGTGTYTSDITSSDPVYNEYKFDNFTTVEEGENIVFTSNNPISNISNVTFEWLNTLTTDMDKPYPNWDMSIRLIDATNNNNLLFEYGYYNFIHKENDNVVNKSSARAINRYQDQYNIKSWSDLYLEWGNNSLALEETGLQYKTELMNVTINEQTGTPYQTSTSDELPRLIPFTQFGDYLRFKLITNLYDTSASEEKILNLSGKTINIQLTNSEGQSKTYNVNTSSSGIASLQINLANGTYKCKPYFEGDDTYIESELPEFEFSINATRVETKLATQDYDGKQHTANGVTYTNPIFNTTGNKISATLSTVTNQKLANQYIDFTLIDKYNSERRKTYSVKTNGNGVAELPINLATGEYIIETQYTGSSIYQPTSKHTNTLIVQLPSNSTITRITGQDEYYTQEEGNLHIITLTDINGKPLANRLITFTVTADKNNSTKEYNIPTNTNGQATLTINLSKEWDGLIHVTSEFKGGDGYAPSLLTNDIILDRDNMNNTVIVPSLKNDSVISTGKFIFDGYLYEYIDNGKNRIPITGATVYMTFKNLTSGLSKTYEETTDSNGRYSYGLRYGSTSEGLGLANGNYEVTLQYLGGINRNSTSKILRFRINSTNTDEDDNIITRPQPTLSFNNTNYDFGSGVLGYKKGIDDLTLELRLHDNNTGISGEQLYITFYNADTNYNIIYDGKQASYTLPLTNNNGITTKLIQFTSNSTNPNKHIVAELEYNGNNTYQGVRTTVPILVNTQDTTGTSYTNPPSDTDIKINTEITITADTTYTTLTDKYVTFTLKDGYNNTLPREIINIQLTDTNNTYNKDYTIITDNNGQGKITLQNLPNNTYTITATYTPPDLTNYTGTTETETITINIPYTSEPKGTSIIFLDNTKTTPQAGDYTRIGVGSGTNTGWNNIQWQDLIVNAKLVDTDGINIPNQYIAWRISFEDDETQNRCYGATTTTENSPGNVQVNQTETNSYKTDTSGYMDFPITLTQTKSVILRAYYDGNENYKPCVASTRITFTIQGNYSLIDNTITNLTDANGNPVKLFNNVPLNESHFGSRLEIEIQNTHLHLKDYGLTSEYGITAPKIDYECEIDPTSCYLQIEVKNLQDKETTTGITSVNTQYWFNILEDTENSKYLPIYQNLIVSPMPLPNRACQFIRRVEDGILHYYDYNPYGDVDYLGDPHNQYEGGCDLQTQDGYSIVDTESGYNPLVISNGLVKASFDRMSKFIRLYRYNYVQGKYVQVQLLKVNEIPDMRLEKYSDDKIIVTFGKTRWTIWRGHPFIQCEHPNTELKILGEYNRVWCEKSENDHLGNPIEQDTRNGYFNTYYSPNLFPYNLHLNDDKKLDNFKLTSTYTNAQLDLSDARGEDRIFFSHTGEATSQLRFPYPSLLKKPENQSFSLYIGDLQTSTTQDITITLNMYNKDVQLIHQLNNTQNITTGTNEINVNFRLNDDIYEETEYIDFTITFTNTSGTCTYALTKFMLYEQYVPNINYTSNNPGKYYDRTKVYFENSYFIKTYNKSDQYGLSIIRPERDYIYLNRLPESNCTVFAPYLKQAQRYDSPELVALEYMTFSEQTQTINRVE